MPMKVQRGDSLIVVTLIAEEVGGGSHILLLLFLLGSSSTARGTASGTASSRAGTTTRATGDGLELLVPGLEDLRQLLAGELLNKILEGLVVGVVELDAHGGEDLLDISSGRLSVATDNRQHVSRDNLHVFKQICSLL